MIGIAADVHQENLDAAPAVRVSALGDAIVRSEVLAAFALLAIILAGLGVYAVTAQSVGERRHELLHGGPHGSNRPAF